MGLFQSQPVPPPQPMVITQSIPGQPGTTTIVYGAPSYAPGYQQPSHLALIGDVFVGAVAADLFVDAIFDGGNPNEKKNKKNKKRTKTKLIKKIKL